MTGYCGNRRFGGAVTARVCALALALGSAPVGALAAQTPSEPQVALLREQAEALFAETTPDANGAQRIIDAWEKVAAAARLFAPDHPEVARADIRVASQLYVLGRNADARVAVERGLAALPDRDPETLVVRAEGVALLGTLFAQAGEADAAIASLETGYAAYMESFAALAPDEIGRGAVVARSNLEFSLSQVLLQLSRTDDALRYQRASLDTREGFLGPNDPDTISSYYGYAGTLRRAGQVDEAERYARIAVERAVQHIDSAHPTYSRALEMLAIVLSRSGRPIEATGYLARSLELKRQHEGPDSLFFGYGIHLLATIYHQRERYADAVPLFAEAAPIFAKYQGEGSPFGLGSQAYAAQGTFALGRGAEALAQLRAVDARMETNSVDTDIAKRIGPDLVRALIRNGDSVEAARIAARDYARLLETEKSGAFALRHARLVDIRAQSVVAGRPQAAVDEARTMLAFLGRDRARGQAGTFETEQRAALDLVMEIAVDCAVPDLMAQAMALATGSGLAQATAFRAERLAADDPEIAAELRALQQADAAVDAADRAFLRALADGTAADAARDTLVQADAVRAATLAALSARDAAAGQMLDPGDASIAAIRAQLGKGEALLAFAPAYDGAYSLLVTADQTIVRRLDLPRADLIALASKVRDGAATMAFDAAASAQLAAVLLPPEARMALDEVETLRILAGGPLASLPFGALLLDEGGQGRATEWLADRFALANIAALGREDRAKRPRGGGLVAFAAPAPFNAGQSGESGEAAGSATFSPAAYFERGGVDATRLAQLPRLPGSANEARTIAREFASGSAQVFLGDAASEANLADPGVARAEVLLFATHGLVAGELEGIAEPALILSRPQQGEGDGVLTASEIARLDLVADWVILTACDSAAGFEGGVPAFAGLVSAFRFAGGGSVLATHWQVRDDVAAYVAVEMLRHYRQHGDKAQALHHAIGRLRRDSGLPGADRPEIWAPFVLID
ncbi:MAG: CHAT domain-containing protein [Sphingomonadales bacterium]|nr:CHAT domain-containing protein [Sphingomonadales bacterium]NCQ21917.1 CHAT domain-containing protein [Sphingomonadales bacterium]NCT04551.1 CHAT domain-containing protein [Sphingomonadales bacterium]